MSASVATRYQQTRSGRMDKRDIWNSGTVSEEQIDDTLKILGAAEKCGSCEGQRRPPGHRPVDADESGLTSLSRSPRFFPELPGDETSAPKPAPDETGPHAVCNRHEYEINGLLGAVYMPGLQGEDGNCYVTDQKYPLVVICHADMGDMILHPNLPKSEWHLEYEPLCQHIASHGFVVITVNRYSPEDLVLSERIIAHVEALSDKYNLSKYLVSEVAVFGHSAGAQHFMDEVDGKTNAELLNGHAVPNTDLVLNIKSFIGLSPSSPPAGIPDLIGGTQSFLGLFPFGDTDGGAKTGVAFRCFDKLGLQKGGGGELAFDKDMVGFQYHTHFAQNEIFTRSFTTAFLRWKLLGDVHYRRFLRQETPVTKKYADYNKHILHQHSEAPRKLLVSGDYPSASLGVDFDENDVEVSEYVDPIPLQLSLRSPHRSKLREITVHPTDGNTEEENRKKVRFTIDDAIVKLWLYRSLSVRIGQKYKNGAMPLDLNFWIKLKLKGVSNGYFREAKDYGLLNPPFSIAWFPSILRSYVIPIKDFNVSNHPLEYIEFQFAQEWTAYLIIADIEIY